MIRLFDFGPVLLAAMLVLLGTTEHGESARVEVAAVASVNEAETVVIPGLQVAEPQVPEVGAKVNVALDEEELYWYYVVDGRTFGAYVAHGTKSGINTAPYCPPGNAVICLFGSTQDDLDDEPVGTPDNDHRIMKGGS